MEEFIHHQNLALFKKCRGAAQLGAGSTHEVTGERTTAEKWNSQAALHQAAAARRVSVYLGQWRTGHHTLRVCSADAEVHFSGGHVMAKWFVPPIVIPAGFIVMVVVMALLRHSFGA